MDTTIVHANRSILLKEIRKLTSAFIIALIVSGVTAFPIEIELRIANDLMNRLQWGNSFAEWIRTVFKGVTETNAKFPFMAYGTDWLAFAHLVIAVAFIGPLKDPVKNIWIIEFGIISCISVLPLAFIAGSIRNIPFYWQLIDCSFGVFGCILLWVCYKKIKRLELILLQDFRTASDKAIMQE